MALSKNLLLFESIQNHGLRLRCWKLPKHDTKHPKSSMKFILRIHHLFACTLPNWLVSSMHTHFLLSFETCFLYSEYYWLGLPVHTEKTHVLCICVCVCYFALRFQCSQFTSFGRKIKGAPTSFLLICTRIILNQVWNCSHAWIKIWEWMEKYCTGSYAISALWYLGFSFLTVNMIAWEFFALEMYISTPLKEFLRFFAKEIRLLTHWYWHWIYGWKDIESMKWKRIRIRKRKRKKGKKEIKEREFIAWDISDTKMYESLYEMQNVKRKSAKYTAPHAVSIKTL